MTQTVRQELLIHDAPVQLHPEALQGTELLRLCVWTSVGHATVSRKRANYFKPLP